MEVLKNKKKVAKTIYSLETLTGEPLPGSKHHVARCGESNRFYDDEDSIELNFEQESWLNFENR